MLNSKVKTVEIAEGSGTQTITMDGEHAELPLTSIDDLHVRKVIANAGSPGSLEGDVASLEGVRFRVEWFGMVATDAAALEGKHPQANAIWRTDSNGVARLHEKPDEGTWPYTDSAGRTMFPLGTVRITELNAPQGAGACRFGTTPGQCIHPHRRRRPQGDAHYTEPVEQRLGRQRRDHDRIPE